MIRDPLKLIMATGTGIALVGTAGLAWSLLLWDLQAQTLPRSPNQLTGNIYPRNIHGLVVYQTHEELRLLERVDLISEGLSVCGLAVVLVGGSKRRMQV